MKKTWVKHNIPSKIQDHGCSSTTKTRGGDKWRRSITYIEQNQQRKPITILKMMQQIQNPNEKERRSHLMH